MHSTDYKAMRFYPDEELQRISGEIEKAVTIPVHIEIESEHRVYNFSEMKEILEKARRIVVQDCGCKTEYKNCSAPRDVCISLDEAADGLLEKAKDNPREVTVDEAIEVLQKSHEAGLVHLAYTIKGEEKPSIVCSCCPCCCHTLGGLIRNAMHPQILTSKYIAAYDDGKCVECEECVERCAFQARQKDNAKLVHDQTKCFGCGLCVSTCPVNAISLVPRAL